jgi:hypothetical protein
MSFLKDGYLSGKRRGLKNPQKALDSVSPSTGSTSPVIALMVSLQ